MDERGPEAAGGVRRFLTFRIDDGLYALQADQVSEVIRAPVVARVPLAPKSLLGLANLRGAILPVASARGLLGMPERKASGDSRAVVLDGGAPVALAVDSIGGLVAVEISQIEIPATGLSREDGGEVAGVFRAGRGEVAKILGVRRMLEAAFVQPVRPERGEAGLKSRAHQTAQSPDDDRERLLTFEVAGQAFALALSGVREVISPPLTAPSRSESHALRVIAYRDTLLPLVSLRGLLGFPVDAGGDGGDKVIVTEVGGTLAGLVADRMGAIIVADPALVEPAPPILAARAGGESRIGAIYRGDGGRRLVSILTPDRLFREDVMRKLGEAQPSTVPAGSAEPGAEQVQLLVFRLGDEEFGLPIAAVDQVARVPESITRVPKAPKFLEGVVNLRGEILPVIDQRRRFAMAASGTPEARRLIVMRAGRHRAGLIVDGVNEVLRCSAASIGEAPHLSGEATRLVSGVVNLHAAGRLVLLLDPEELLTRAERDLMDSFAPGTGQAG